VLVCSGIRAEGGDDGLDWGSTFSMYSNSRPSMVWRTISLSSASVRRRGNSSGQYRGSRFCWVISRDEKIPVLINCRSTDLYTVLRGYFPSGVLQRVGAVGVRISICRSACRRWFFCLSVRPFGSGRFVSHKYKESSLSFAGGRGFQVL
jgi:hypothetical protein